MIPGGVEVRRELQLRNDILAFGFSGERVGDLTAVGLLEGPLLDHILKSAESAPTGLVVVDMRNVAALSTAGTGRLLALNKRLNQVRRKMVLLINDPVIREVLSITHLDRQFLVAANEAELRELVSHYTPAPPQPSSHEGPPVEFSESELAEMESAGITLDDAIRVIEEMRR